MMPPSLHVCNGLASSADSLWYVLCDLLSQSLHHSISWTSIQIICYILLPYSWYNSAQNVINSSVGGSDYHANFIKIRSVFVLS